MRRVVLKSPVLENCTPGSVRGAPGNRRPYLAIMQREGPRDHSSMILSGHDSVVSGCCFAALCSPRLRRYCGARPRLLII
jgi:hypothetical protein